MPTATHDGQEDAPNRLVAVVGPSGAGQGYHDRIGAGAPCGRRDERLSQAGKDVRSAAADAENYESLTVEAFEVRLRAGGFAFWWEAHGLRYMAPAGNEVDIEAAARPCVQCIAPT